MQGKSSVGMRVGAMVFSYLVALLMLICVIAVTAEEMATPVQWIIVLVLIAQAVLVSIPNMGTLIAGGVIAGLAGLYLLITVFTLLPYVSYINRVGGPGTIIFIVYIIITIFEILTCILASIAAVRIKGNAGSNYYNAPYQGGYQQNPYQQNPYQQNPYQQNPYQQNTYQQNAYQQNTAAQQPDGNQEQPAGPADGAAGQIYCPSCGMANSADSMFCAGCGNKLK